MLDFTFDQSGFDRLTRLLSTLDVTDHLPPNHIIALLFRASYNDLNSCSVDLASVDQYQSEHLELIYSLLTTYITFSCSPRVKISSASFVKLVKCRSSIFKLLQLLPPDHFISLRSQAADLVRCESDKTQYA